VFWPTIERPGSRIATCSETRTRRNDRPRLRRNGGDPDEHGRTCWACGRGEAGTSLRRAIRGVVREGVVFWLRG
jgi:hypothetical protein